jgi:hypothetical protein
VNTPCWHVTTKGGETYGVAAATATDARSMVNDRLVTEDPGTDWPDKARRVGTWDVAYGTVLHY